MPPRRIRAAAAAALAALVLQTPLASQAGPLAGFDAAVARAVQDWATPGLAVAVVKDGRVVFSKGYGVRELGKPQPVDTHTLFAIGSTTKAMTAALVGMLVDEKKLAWDDPVVKHLPWFRLKDPYLTREITVRDLLTHRAGLGNADYLWYGQTMSSREILERVALLDPAYSLRGSFIYQNVMYAAAGAVIEAVSGTSWEQMIRTRIFEPLGMTDTIATAAALASQPNVARPHDTIDGELRVIENASVDGVAPAGSVWSSVHDMAKWMQMLLDGGKAGGRTLLAPETLAELFEPQAMVTPEAFYPTARLTKPHWTTYGLGWFQQDYRGRAVDFHTGSIDGMVAIHGLVRDDRLGVYVLANRDHAELRHALMLDVFDRHIGSPARDWSAELRTLYAGLQKEADERRQKQESRRVTGTSPTLPLARYAGTYSDPLYGDIVVTLDGDRLRARYGSAFSGVLEHWNYDTFRAVWDARWRGTALVTFALDAYGEVVRLEALGTRFARRPPAQQSSAYAMVLAALVQDAARASKWIVSEGLSKSTRKPRTVARLPADRPIHGEAGPVMPLLALECHGGQLAAYVHAGIERLGAPPLLVAWDDGDVQEDWSWTLTPRGSSLESSAPAGFVRALSSSSRVQIELRPRSTSRQLVTFTLAGVHAVVEQLGSACIVEPSMVARGPALSGAE